MLSNWVYSLQLVICSCFCMMLLIQTSAPLELPSVVPLSAQLYGVLESYWTQLWCKNCQVLSWFNTALNRRQSQSACNAKAIGDLGTTAQLKERSCGAWCVGMQICSFRLCKFKPFPYQLHSFDWLKFISPHPNSCSALRYITELGEESRPATRTCNAATKPTPQCLPQHLMPCLFSFLPKWDLHECQHLVQAILYPGSVPCHHLEEGLQSKAWNSKAFHFVSCREHSISVCVCCSESFTLANKLRAACV